MCVQIILSDLDFFLKKANLKLEDTMDQPLNVINVGPICNCKLEDLESIFFVKMIIAEQLDS